MGKIIMSQELEKELRSDAIIFTPDQIRQVEEMASMLTLEQIAKVMGVGRTTLARIKERQPEVEEAYQRGRITGLHEVAKSLLKNARNGHFQSQKFYLGTQFGWVEKKEITVTKNALDDVLDHIVGEEPMEGEEPSDE